MDSEIVAKQVQLKSILRSTSIARKASAQGVTFGPILTIATESPDDSVPQGSSELETSADNASNWDAIMAADSACCTKPPADDDGSDTGSDDSVVRLDDKSEDNVEQEPAISDKALHDLTKPSRFSLARNPGKSIPNLHLAAGDLRERRQQLLAEMRLRREKSKPTPVSDQPLPTSSSALDLEKKISTSFQLSNVKHESVSFDDGRDLGRTPKEIRELRAYITQETKHLIAFQLVYEQEDCTLVAGRLCGQIFPGAIVQALQLRKFEYIVGMTTFRGHDGIVGIAVNTTESRSEKFGDCNLSKYQAKRLVCPSNELQPPTMIFEGYSGSMAAVSGSFGHGSIDSLTPVFSAWSKTTFLLLCLLRRLASNYESLSEQDRLVVQRWAKARILVGLPENAVPVWIMDAERQECKECKIAFSFWRRRHHCRICGEIFCSTCCNQFRFISSYLPCLDCDDEGEHRLCHQCCSKADSIWKIIRETH